jgi:hypothetical protein
MKNRFQLTRTRRRQGGYALLLVVFLTSLVVVGTMSIGLRILTEGRREKEQEMIWRGKQYTRGIKLYYRKLGRFPNSMDDLVKPKIGNLRFMRQAYKDPMNKEDGAWRLIYVGPAGQLIGSLNPAVSNVQMPGGAAGAAQPGQAPGNASSTFGGIGGQSGTSGSFSPTGTAPGAPTNGQGAPGSALGTSAAGTVTGAQGSDAGATGTDSQAVPNGDTPTIMGGSIIGVGSKINQRSVIIFEKAHNYRLFEFIWDPSKDMGIISSPAAPIGTPAGAPGQNPTSPQPGNPLNPPSTPPTTMPNPNPSQP